VLVMPQAARRFHRSSVDLWHFEPQEAAGQPVVPE